MRAWKVEAMQGKPIELEMQLNKLQQKGFEIHTIFPSSFGYTIVAFMDQQPTYSAIGMDSPL